MMAFHLLAPFLALQAQAPLEPQASATTAVSAAAGESSTLRAWDLRVGEMGYRLAVRGAHLCEAKYPATGMLMHHLAEYEPEDQTLMIGRYGLDRGPGILSVIAGTPAAAAGLKAGDVILAVNGLAFRAPRAISAERKRKKRRSLIEESEAQIEQQLRSGPVRLRILREGREMDVTLSSIPACLGRVRLARSHQVNAFASGRYAIMTTALLGFLENENEMAVVLAHEMSHNILGHPDWLDEQGVPKGGPFRAFGKNASRVWKTEAEADRFGLQLMWAAGYDVEAAIPFWQRLYRKYDSLPQIWRTHPSLPVRTRIARETIASLPPRPAG